MIAAALALGAVTVEQTPPWKPTLSEHFEMLCAMERYATAGRLANPDSVMTERMSATDDMDRIVARIVARAYEELRAAGNAVHPTDVT